MIENRNTAHKTPIDSQKAQQQKHGSYLHTYRLFGKINTMANAGLRVR